MYLCLLLNYYIIFFRDNQKATITSESVNSKKNHVGSPFLVYINETRSEMRRMTIIRETSIIQPLTFMLFINNDLTFLEVKHIFYSLSSLCLIYNIKF